MASPTTPVSLGPDELYDALSNDRRRACVRHLTADGEWVAVRALADAVASETAADPEAAAESTYISLIQIHLPKLASYGVVVYDEDEKVVSAGPAHDQAVTCIEEHAESGRGGSEQALHPATFAVSALGLALALVRPTATAVLVGLVLVVQLVGLVVATNGRLEGSISERTSRWTS